MSKVFTALAVSVDGYITGRDPGPGRALGNGGTLFDWYDRQDNADYFQHLSDRVGAVVTGRTTYDDCEGFGGDGPHPTAPMVVVSHRPPPPEFADSERQSFAGDVTEAIEQARTLAGGKDVGIQGGVTLSAAIDAGLVDEVILHQVPVLLGAGRPYFAGLSQQVGLEFVEAVPGDGVTHLRYEVLR
jgi:dihydrofolate reductase